MNPAYDDRLISAALDIAVTAAINGDGPFGAVLVLDERVIGEGSDVSRRTGDPTDHAELVAIRSALATIAPSALPDCTLYSSCEPCMMCTAAILRSGISTVYYTATRERAESYGYHDVMPAKTLRSLAAHQSTMHLVTDGGFSSERPFRLSRH